MVPAERQPGAPDDIARAARLLAEAKRPMFICGGGVVTSGAEAELLALAERLDAPVATTITGQGAIAETHALAVGVVGSNGGTPETRAIVERADLIVFLACRAGSVTTERWRFPAPGAAKIVQIDIDTRVLGATYEPDAAIAGDAKLVLEALAGELGDAKRETGARAAVEEARRAKFETFDVLAHADTTPIRPERLVADLSAVMPDDGVVVVDPGTPCPYFSAYYTLPRSGRHLISNRAHGALGYALPAIIGAKTARPEATCVAVMGDGSFGMAAGEMETMVRLGLDVTLVVVSNATYGWIRAGQRHGYDKRFFATSFSRTDHARVAEGFGLTARTVTDPRNLKSTLEQALAHEGPALVDVICQPLDEANAPVSEWVA
jgi:acetolactate synthase-1/2/3 large subunit